MAITLDGTNGITSSGVITAPDGSASAPAITNDGDTNTGIYFPSADSVAITTGGTAAVTVDSGQRTKFPTTIGIGGATPSTSGSGVSFPATQSASTNANTLDDYEEGTFTPTAYGLSSAGTTTYTIQSGTYTKIGNQVTVVTATYWTAMTGTGSIRIGNLPFTSSVVSPGSVLIDDLNWDGGSQITPLIVENEALIRIYYCGDNIATAQQQCVNESAGIRVTLTYFI